MNIISFFKEDIWSLDEQQMPFFQAFFFKCLKVLLLALQGFHRDLCQLRASALTLYSLLAIVPVIAMLFGIAKGFGLEAMLEQQLIEQVPHQDATVTKLIGFAQNLLNSTKGEVVAGIGIIVLLWSVINMIGNIEESFNYIWKISKARALGRKISDYLSLMLLAPVFLILSGSISVYMHAKLSWLSTVITLPDSGEGLLLSLLNYFPLLLIIGLFSFIFIFVPNHTIRYQAGIIAGIFTGVLYQIIQWLYLSLQFGVSGYNAVYGSFAALPLFVIWVQMGWMVVLLGCEVAFYIQNYESHRDQFYFSELSFALKKTLALQVMRLIIKNFVAQLEPLTAEQAAGKLSISIAIIQPLLELLVACHLLIELNSPDEDDRFIPAVDINILTAAYVITTLEQFGQDSLPGVSSEVFTESDASQLQDRLLKEL